MNITQTTFPVAVKLSAQDFLSESVRALALATQELEATEAELRALSARTTDAFFVDWLGADSPALAMTDTPASPEVAAQHTLVRERYFAQRAHVSLLTESVGVVSQMLTHA